MRRLAHIGIALVCSACSVEFNEEAYTPLCWEPASCVRYLNLMEATEDWMDNAGAPVDADDLQRWNQGIESVDGVFGFIGVDEISDDDKLERLQFLKEHENLIREIGGIVDVELRNILPRVLGRNSSEQRENIRVVVAPFLQMTNASVGTANDSDIVLVIAPDRLAFNVAERGQSLTWVRTVVAHELTHASHFAMVPYSTTFRRANPMHRSLWVEGLALHGSIRATDTPRSLADIIGESNAAICERTGRQLAADYRNDMEDADQSEIWWADRGADPRAYGIVTPGYCVAFLVMESLMAQHDFEDLLLLPPAEAYPMLTLALEQLSALN